jgi:PAS domain S-box-containing protein
MLFKIAPDGKCFFINEAFLKHFGWHESDVLDFGFEDLVHDDDRPEIRLKWQKAIDTQANFKDTQVIRDCHVQWHR